MSKSPVNYQTLGSLRKKGNAAHGQLHSSQSYWGQQRRCQEWRRLDRRQSATASVLAQVIFWKILPYLKREEGQNKDS